MKYKSYAFWTSLAAALVVVVNTVASAFGYKADEKIIYDIIMGICGVLIVLGVVKMPSAPQETLTDENEKIEPEKNEDKE